MTPEEKIIVQIERLLDLFSAETKIAEGLFLKDDLRLKFYYAPGNTLVSLFFHMSAIDSTICKKSWWQSRFNKKEPSELDKGAIKNFDGFTRFSFLVFFFSHIETNFRKIINIISPQFDVKRDKSFYSIYTEFFDKTGQSQFKELFHIIRLTRNTLHTNGIYISNSGEDVEYQWKGELYTFRHLKLVEFLTWDKFLYLMEEMFYVLKDTVNNPLVKSFPYIKDDFN